MAKRFPRIIHISDVHISSSNYQLDVPDVVVYHDTGRRVSELLNFFDSSLGKLNANIIIHTGDLTDSGDEADYQKARFGFLNHFLSRTPYMIYNIPGNHDYFCHGNNCPYPPFGPNPDEESGSRLSRKGNFLFYVTEYDKYPHIYPDSFPYIIPVDDDPQIGWIVLLDSMRGIFGQHNSFAQGCFGDDQLTKLDKFLNDPQTLKNRANSARILVALHHSPFSGPENNTGGLQDAQRFLQIITDRIDCLLFGHTTPPGVLSQGSSGEFDKFQRDYKIPLISCVNLQNMDSPPSGDIVVVDIEKNQRELYNTSGVGPIITRGTYPVRQRESIYIDASYTLGHHGVDGNGFGFYEVTVTANVFGLEKPYGFEWELDPNKPNSQKVSGYNNVQKFNILLGAINGPYNYFHEIKIISSDKNAKAETTLPIQLSMPYVRLSAKHVIQRDKTEIKVGAVTPFGVSILSNGIHVLFTVNDIVTVNATCQGLLGRLNINWNPTPSSINGNLEVTYQVNDNLAEFVDIKVTDQIGQKAQDRIRIRGLFLSGFIPRSQIPVAIQQKIPGPIPEVIKFSNPANPIINIKEVKIALSGDFLKGTGCLKFNDNLSINITSLANIRK